MVCTVEAWEGLLPQLRLLWEAFHKTGLSRQALGWSCLMVVMYNGRANNSDRVMMQLLRHVNVIQAYMTSHAVLPNIACVDKRVKIEMEDGSKPLHKFTDLCREVMWLSSMAPDGTLKLLFDAIMPVVLGQQQGSAIITYRTDNTEAAALIRKIHRSITGWFFGYWQNVMC
jgi:hypothetical protein